MDRTALIVGATGLVGSRLLTRLLDDPAYARVVALSRRPLAIPHLKLEGGVADFRHLDEVSLPAVDDVFCCLGTTIRKAGSREAFREVDCAWPLAIARKALDAGASQFLFVSAAGADPASRVFYSRVKGELEAAAAKLPYRGVVALRPSLLVGAREEFRAGERLAGALLVPVARWLPAAWRPIDAGDVATAMHVLAGRRLAGVHVIGNEAIARLARREG